MNRFFALMFAVLALVAGACGSTTTDDTTATTVVAEPEASTDEAMADDASDDDGDDAMVDDDSDHAVSDDDDDDAMVDGSSDGASSGGSDGDGPSTPAEGTLGALLFADTLDGSDQTSSARYEGRFSMVGGPDSEFPGAIEMVIEGGYDRDADAMEMVLDLTGLMEAAASADAGGGAIPPGFEEFFAEPLEIRAIGDEAWMKWSLLALFTGGDADTWIAMDASEVGGATDGFGVAAPTTSPSDFFDSLAGADASVSQVGTETIRGVETEHWQAFVDVENLAADATPEERAELESQFGDLSETQFPIDLWIGADDGLLYRYQLDLPAEALAAQGDGLEAATFAFELYDYGTDLGIEPPPADKVIDDSSFLTG